MSEFATEFAVSHQINKATFTAEVTGWLDGMEASMVLASSAKADLDEDNPVLQAENGEELRMLVLQGSDRPDALGFIHRIPDQEGRIWQTEAVWKRLETQEAVLRVRGQCLAADSLPFLPVPNKPFFIKAILQEGWARADGLLDVDERPHALPDNDDGLELAQAIIRGQASNRLPIVYVSVTDEDSPAIDSRNLERLAFALGGVAHVVVEPSRSFSFDLANRLNARTAMAEPLA